MKQNLHKFVLFAEYIRVMKFKMRGKTRIKNGNDEICIYFRRELEWKEGFLRTR
jgi:hypothetical protein